MPSERSPGRRQGPETPPAPPQHPGFFPAPGAPRPQLTAQGSRLGSPCSSSGCRAGLEKLHPQQGPRPESNSAATPPLCPGRRKSTRIGLAPRTGKATRPPTAACRAGPWWAPALPSPQPAAEDSCSRAEGDWGCAGPGPRALLLPGKPPAVKNIT